MESSLQLLLFTVTDRRYAVPAQAVHAVTSREAAGDVPCLELARLLGGRPHRRGRMAIVLQQGGEPACALAVDHVLEVDSLPLVGLHALPFPLQATGSIFAVYLPPSEPGTSIPVFDPAVLVADARRQGRKKAV